MKTPDEIKKGLKCCAVDACYHTTGECPYDGVGACVREVCADAYTYIQQLQRERDAAVDMLIKIANDTGSCIGCLHYTQPGYKCYLWEITANCYEWRGVPQEVE